MNVRCRMMVVLVLGCLATSDVQAFSASYDQKVTTGRAVITSKVILHDDRFRIEATLDGVTSVTIRNAQGIYQYLPKEGIAMQLPGLDPAQQPLAHSDNYHAYLEAHHAQRLRAETINGYPCEVYQLIDPALRGTTTVWVWTEKAFPIRLEMEGSDGTTIAELSNIHTEIVPPESVFQLPPGVQLMGADTLLQGTASQ